MDRHFRTVLFSLRGFITAGQRATVRVLFRFSLIFLFAFCNALHADEDLEDFEFDTADLLLRIAAANHDSGIYKSAKNLAALFNWQQMPEGFEGGQQQRAITVATSGAEASVIDLLEGRAELAIVRADVADAVFQSHQDDSAARQNTLRLIATHKPEFLHIVVRADFEGSSLNSLDGTRVNVGKTFEHSSHAVPELLRAAGCDVNSMTLFYAPPTEALRRLQEGGLDAVVFFDQAPSKLIAQDINELKLRMLPYPMPDFGDSGNTVQSASNYYTTTTSADFYQQPETVSSILGATYLLTRSDVPSSAIEPLVQLLSVQPQLPALKDGDGAPLDKKAAVKPLLRALSISNSLSPIPLHPSSQLLIDIFADLPASDADANPNKAQGQRAEAAGQ